jgi:hypothetical protein
MEVYMTWAVLQRQQERARRRHRLAQKQPALSAAEQQAEDARGYLLQTAEEITVCYASYFDAIALSSTNCSSLEIRTIVRLEDLCPCTFKR